MRVLLLFPLALLAIAAAAAISASAAPNPCGIDIIIADPAKEAAITSTSPAAVTFHGNYTANIPSGTRGQLTLTGSVDVGWVITMSPASITITVARTGSFTATSVVPAGTLASDVGTATITARMTVAGIQCTDEESGLTIAPLPYFDGLVAKATPTNVTLSGAMGTFALEVSGSANVPVTVELTFETPDGISARAPATVPLAAPGSGPMNSTVTVEVSGRYVAGGVYSIRAVLHGVTPQGLTKDTSLEVPVRATSDPRCDGCPLGSSGAPILVAGLAAAAVVGFVWWRRR